MITTSTYQVAGFLMFLEMRVMRIPQKDPKGWFIMGKPTIIDDL
jgi:hypothetical protein